MKQIFVINEHHKIMNLMVFINYKNFTSNKQQYAEIFIEAIIEI